MTRADQDLVQLTNIIGIRQSLVFILNLEQICGQERQVKYLNNDVMRALILQYRNDIYNHIYNI